MAFEFTFASHFGQYQFSFNININNYLMWDFKMHSMYESKFYSNVLFNKKLIWVSWTF
jgi:hypothetical protein